jgi:dTMP kinase
LTERLKQDGYKVIQSEFPRYDTSTGLLIRQHLTGQWNVNKETFELIMTADKQSQQKWFEQLENEGYDFLILDRYLLSQVAYGMANGMDGRWIVELHKYMRYPDLDIVIDIPVEVSMTRKGKHGANDKYESDYEMLSRVRDYYINVSTFYSAPIKRIVNGEREVGVIHEEIYNIVNSLYGGDK